MHIKLNINEIWEQKWYIYLLLISFRGCSTTTYLKAGKAINLSLCTVCAFVGGCTMYTLYKPQSAHQVLISGVHSIMMEKINPGWWGCRGTSTSFHSIYHHVQSAVYAPAERADTCPYFISTPICTLRYKPTIYAPMIYCIEIDRCWKLNKFLICKMRKNALFFCTCFKVWKRVNVTQKMWKKLIWAS
jgi:hypothetical protein